MRLTRSPAAGLSGSKRHRARSDRRGRRRRRLLPRLRRRGAHVRPRARRPARRRTATLRALRGQGDPACQRVGGAADAAPRRGRAPPRRGGRERGRLPDRDADCRVPVPARQGAGARPARLASPLRLRVSRIGLLGLSRRGPFALDFERFVITVRRGPGCAEPQPSARPAHRVGAPSRLRRPCDVPPFGQ